MASIAMMHRPKSQFDVCGAMISTKRGSLGRLPTTRQPTSARSWFASARLDGVPRRGQPTGGSLTYRSAAYTAATNFPATSLEFGRIWTMNTITSRSAGSTL